MATQANPTVGLATTVRGPGARGESEFLRALADHALANADLTARESVRGLTPGEIEESSGLSRPSITALLRRFAHILQPQSADGMPVRQPDNAVRWTIDPDGGIVAAAELGPEQAPAVAISDLYGRRIAGPVRPQDQLATADEIVDWASDQIKQLLEGRSSNEVVGVGVEHCRTD